MSDTTAGDEREALARMLYRLMWQGESDGWTTFEHVYRQRAELLLAAGWRRDGVDPGALRAIQRDLGSFVEQGEGDEFDLIDAYGVAFKRIFALLDAPASPAAGHETGDQA